MHILFKSYGNESRKSVPNCTLPAYLEIRINPNMGDDSSDRFSLVVIVLRCGLPCSR